MSKYGGDLYGYDPTVADRKPPLSDEQIDIAILWLESNEGEGAEKEACGAAADWLKVERNQRAVRRVQKMVGGAPASRVREALTQKWKAANSVEEAS